MPRRRFPAAGTAPTKTQTGGPMHDLIKSSIEAHGGLARWNEIRQISARFAAGGPAFKQRGQEAFTEMPTRVSVDAREQKTTFAPFLAPNQCAIYQPDRTSIETADGTLLDELRNPRSSFKGSPWTATQLAYFAGYAIWMYLTVPFSLLCDGIGCEETAPWHEDGESWRALKVTFPTAYVTHSIEQTLYFDANGMIRRHDYTVEISGGVATAHYLHDHQRFDGIVFPTRRRVYLRGAGRQPQKNLAVITADLSDFRLSPTAP
jgi:hypothetical protein